VPQPGRYLKFNGTIWDNANDEDGPFSESSGAVYYSGAKDVGIGINVPSRKLTIADGAATCYLNIQNSSTGYTSSDGLTLGMSGVDGILTTLENGKLHLGCNSAIKMTISPGGNVGIGTTVPSYNLDITGELNLNKGISNGIALRCNGEEALWYNGTYFSWGYGGNYNYFGDKIFIGAVATNPGSNLLVVNGPAAKPGGGSWSTWSDSRLKDIHGRYTRGLNEIASLEPISYSYKQGNSANLPADQEYVGLVAQDVRKVFPEAVSRGDDGYLQLDMNPVNIALINAVRELKAENDQLKSRLERLEQLISAEAKR
jgi:hypothetical protein